MNEPIIHATGWSPRKAEQAQELLATSHAHLQFTGVLFADDTRPLPAAFSLSHLRLLKINQYGWGCCWMHAPKRIKELMDAGSGFQAEPVSRAMIGYQGERLMAPMNNGVIGNPSDGGSVMQAFLAMADASEGGIGTCHETKWPYCSADLCERSQYAGWDGDRARAEGRQYLAGGPPAGAIADGNLSRVHKVTNLEIGSGDPWKRAIYNAHAVGIGIWWPSGWDTQGATFFSSIGSGEYGHALAVIGWIVHNGELYWQIDNWHGELYAPLSAELAATVPGYKPTSVDKTADFWVSDTVLRRVMGYGNAEHVIAASSTGFTKKDPLANLPKGLAF